MGNTTGRSILGGMGPPHALQLASVLKFTKVHLSHSQYVVLVG